MIRPLGDRILVQPIKPPDVSESGLVLIAEDPKPDQEGVVIAVGRPVHPRQKEAMALAGRLEGIQDRLADGDNDRIIEVEERKAMKAAAALLRDLVRREPAVKVGEDVVFSAYVGQMVRFNDSDEQSYLLLREEDILAVLESA